MILITYHSFKMLLAASQTNYYKRSYIEGWDGGKVTRQGWIVHTIADEQVCPYPLCVQSIPVLSLSFLCHSYLLL